MTLDRGMCDSSNDGMLLGQLKDLDLSLPPCALAAFVGLLAAGFLVYKIGRVVAKGLRDWPEPGERRCRRCEYDLTGNQSGRCPECGERIG